MQGDVPHLGHMRTVNKVWAELESRNGNIFEGEVNATPKSWNPKTGLKNDKEKK